MGCRPPTIVWLADLDQYRTRRAPYGMSQSEVSSLIVTSNHGRPTHPAILIATSDEELVNRVASTPGAVGVVDVYSINSSVAVVRSQANSSRTRLPVARKLRRSNFVIW